MCDFTDRDGNVLEVNDEILYWSSKGKDWFKASVREIITITKNTYVPDGNGGYTQGPVTKTKIKVAKWHDTSKRYLNYGYMNLSKPDVIRKV